MRRPRLQSTFARAVVPVAAGIGFFGLLALALWGVAALMSRDTGAATERLTPSTSGAMLPLENAYNEPATPARPADTTRPVHCSRSTGKPKARARSAESRTARKLYPHGACNSRCANSTPPATRHNVRPK